METADLRHLGSRRRRAARGTGGGGRMSGLGSETRRMPSRRMLLLVGLYCCGAGMAEYEREWGERRRRLQGRGRCGGVVLLCFP
jgi:hypothetical protein